LGRNVSWRVPGPLEIWGLRHMRGKTVGGAGGSGMEWRRNARAVNLGRPRRQGGSKGRTCRLRGKGDRRGLGMGSGMMA
jgi:hypothetical protein